MTSALQLAACSTQKVGCSQSRARTRSRRRATSGANSRLPCGPLRRAAGWEVALSGSGVWGSFIHVFYDALVLEAEPGAPAVPGLGVPGGVALGLTLISLGQLASYGSDFLRRREMRRPFQSRYHEPRDR